MLHVYRQNHKLRKEKNISMSIKFVSLSAEMNPFNCNIWSKASGCIRDITVFSEVKFQ